ncbi:MAG: hypothetical protein KatS3mg115_0367 [Candidatus Poribacteria bacterium]|nr:MAG: hypothetical protein KatS3mg115_0367 [Candidatus Poribacteria bacterium]
MTRDLVLFVVVPSVLLGLAVRYVPLRLCDRYVLRKFAALFLLSFLLEVALILLVRLGDKELGTIFDQTSTVQEAIALFLYKAPRRVLEVIPAAGILGTFFTVGSLLRSNELTAFRAAGINLYRFALPIGGFTLLACLITIGFVDRVVAPATARATAIEESRPTDRDRDVIFRVRPDVFGYIQTIDLRLREARRVTFYELEGNRLRREVFAARATWTETAWVLERGWVREYGLEEEQTDGRPSPPFQTAALTPLGGTVQFWPFQRMERPLTADPRVLVATANHPETMTFKQLREIIRFKRMAGQSPRKEIVQLHHNIAYPFALLVGVVLAFPLSMQFGRFAIALGFPATMFFSFLYWGLAIATFEAMGEVGRIPPAIAPWIANGLFLAFGLLLFRGIRR